MSIHNKVNFFTVNEERYDEGSVDRKPKLTNCENRIAYVFTSVLVSQYHELTSMFKAFSQKSLRRLQDTIHKVFP